MVGGKLVRCLLEDGQGRLILRLSLLLLLLLGCLPLGKLLALLRCGGVHVKVASLEEVDVVVRGRDKRLILTLFADLLLGHLSSD